MPVGKRSGALFKSCMASVFSGKQELGKTFVRNGITTRYIHVVSKHPHLSSSIFFSKVTLMLQIAFIALEPEQTGLQEAAPQTLPESQQHHQKLFYPSTYSGISLHRM